MTKHKNIIVIVYRDLLDDGYIDNYELSRQSGSLKIKEQIVPGRFGYSNMYIRHLSVTYNDRDILIISYTNYELTDSKEHEIITSSFNLLCKRYAE